MPEQIDETLNKFPLLKREREGGCWWSDAIYRRVEMKLAQHHTNAAKFNLKGVGDDLKEDLRWGVDSIRLIYDAKRMDEFNEVPSRKDAWEPCLAFHGTQLSNFRGIIRDNFEVDRPGGWYGNGAYFTSNLVYSQHYIGGVGRAPPLQYTQYGFLLPKIGNVVYIFGAMLKPGRCARVPEDTTPPGQSYQGIYRNKPKDPDFDSHIALVSNRVPSNPSSVGFRPVANWKDSFAEEIVIFEKRRILPRFIIGLKRLEPDGS